VLALALVVAVLVLAGGTFAGAQEDPPPTDPPPPTSPPPTDPPSTDPPPTSPPPTDPPATQPTSTAPGATAPGATPPPATPAPPASTAPGGGGPATTIRRNPVTTQARARPNEAEPPAGEEPPTSDAAEVDPGAAPARQPATTGARLPLLVAPTTTPESPAIALVEGAPAASSKVLPLAVIVAIGLGGLVLVLRPNGRARSATDPAVNPLLLAGPSVVMPPGRAGGTPPPPPPPPLPSGSAPPRPHEPRPDATDQALPETGGPRSPSAPGAAASDLPAIADLVAEARRGRRAPAPADPA